MTFENVLVDIDGPVATVTFNRPDRLNALSEGLQRDYEAALQELDGGIDVRVIRLKGAGAAFCSGYDLQGGYQADGESYGRLGEPTPPVQGRPVLGDIPQSPVILDREGLRKRIERWLRIWNFRKPVIAQVHGYAISGGLDVLGAADLAFAAEGTKFGHPAARGSGIPLTMGMLPMKIGFSRTKQLMFTGDLIDARQAADWGLVNGVFPADELDDRVMEYCQRIALNNMDSLTMHKHVTNRWAEVMGIRLGALEGAEFDAIFHSTPAVSAFSAAVLAGGGLKAGLNWRDGAFEATPSPLTPTATSLAQ